MMPLRPVAVAAPGYCIAAAARGRAAGKAAPAAQWLHARRVGVWPLAAPAAYCNARTCITTAQMTVESIKSKVNTHTGSSVDTMVLQLKDEGGRLVAVLDDNTRKLGFYSPRSGCASVCALLRALRPRRPPKRRPAPPAARQPCNPLQTAPLTCPPPSAPRCPRPQLDAPRDRHRRRLPRGAGLAGGRVQGPEVRDKRRGLQQAGQHVPQLQGSQGRRRPQLDPGEGAGDARG